jgi:anti-anti-sigma factor
MEIIESRLGDVTVVAPKGHLDTVSSTPLEERLRALIEAGARQMLLDFTELDYINSSGLKVILITAKHLDAVGGKLVLCGLSANVRMIFEMIGFSRILTIVPGRDEAVRALAPDGAPA